MAFAPIPRARWQATFAVAGAWLLWWRVGGLPVIVLAVLASVFALLAWLAPARYAPVQRGIDRLAHGLLGGLSWLLLGLVYFGLFTPLRIWRRLTRHDPLHLRPDPTASSYLRPLPPAAPGRFDRQF
jgi:hypothetical protein